MSTQVTLFQQESNATLSKKFQPLVAAGVGSDLGDGIKGSYGIIGIKAGKFRVKYKGDENVLMDHSSGVPVPVGFIDVVIVKANAFLNKQYFEGKYQEGVNAAPVCYSLDGVKPSDASTKKQATACALCPKNQFGSLIGDNGVKQKACRDTKKLAVVPLADIRNATMGGAMLFRVPPSSLKDLSAMADALKGRGYPYNSVAVRISFDLNASHPKPVFKAIRPLTDDEADLVLEMFESDSVMRVLADNDVVADHGEEAVQTSEPVQPAGVTARVHVPKPDSTQPVPQQPARPPVLPPPPSSLQIGGVVVQPIGPAVVVQPAADPTPRVLHLKPDNEPAAQVNPFAPPPTAPAPTAVPQAANPFSPPPTVNKPKARKEKPVEDAVVDSPPVENTQLNSDIASILSGLDMG
jgi:hypothetical protein